MLVLCQLVDLLWQILELCQHVFVHVLDGLPHCGCSLLHVGDGVAWSLDILSLLILAIIPSMALCNSLMLAIAVNVFDQDLLLALYLASSVLALA